MWFAEGRGEGAGGHLVATLVAAWPFPPGKPTLFPAAGDQKSFPVRDFRHNLEALKKSVVGGLAGAALARWLLLLKETVGFFSACSEFRGPLLWHK